MLLLLNFLGADFLTKFIGDVAQFVFELELREADIFEILFLDAPLTIEGARFVLIFLGLLLEAVEVLEMLGVHCFAGWLRCDAVEVITACLVAGKEK